MKTCSRFARCALLALIGLSCLTPMLSAATATNPTLYAESDGIADAKERRELRLASLTLDVLIEGSIAATTLTAAFAGVPDEIVEGHFSLALPKGAIVNGYARDVENRLIRGVLIPGPKARDAYDAKVRQGIDPGFAEVSAANVFSTNVFPIREDSGRTIRVQFVSPVHRGLALPLTTATIDSIEIRVRAREVTAAPQLELPAGLVATWRRIRDGYAASVTARNMSLQGSLAIGPVMPRRPALVSRDEAGQPFFQVRDVFPEEQSTLRPQRVRVYWDHSLSRRDDALERETELLERYVSFAAEQERPPIDLVTFNSGGARILEIDSVERLRGELASLSYRGGTSFAVLDGLRLPKAEVCLLFSDGNATIDRRDTFEPDCQLRAITSATDADRGYLAHLTRDSGGVVIPLGTASVENAYQRLVKQVPIITGATNADGIPLSFAVIDNGANGFFIVGEGPRTTDVLLHFKGAYGRTFAQRYNPRRARHGYFDGTAALWAADQIARLAASDTRFDELARLAQRYSIASSTLAFVVLETPEDYAWADVALPKDYPQTARAAYAQASVERDAQRIEDREWHIESLRDAWQHQKEWWSQDFDPRARPQRKGGGRSAPSAVEHDVSEIIVTASHRREEVLKSSPIAVMPWQVDRPNLRALDEAAPNELASALAAQERDHGQLPAFYLDTAEWLYQRDQANEASEMLLSALELPLCNDDTRAIVADRLVRYGYFDRGIALFERAARLASHRPQPKMQLALALAKRAAVRTRSAKRDLLRAIQLLNEVAMTPWNGGYEGIAMIALMEANALIPKLDRFGGARVALAPELIALLDLDIRVVIQWNTAATDLDLWVDEPNGERAIYSNRHTAIGGRLSKDMRGGYGPEEYLLRRAAPGEYRVNIDAFATDAINPNGATTVTARLIHDFGRPNEHEESVDVELLPDATGERLVGRILVGGAE